MKSEKKQNKQTKRTRPPLIGEREGVLVKSKTMGKKGAPGPARHRTHNTLGQPVLKYSTGASLEWLSEGGG